MTTSSRFWVVLLAVAAFLFDASFAFTPVATTSVSFSLNAIVSKDAIDDVSYSVKVAKPMGVIFGENPEPFFGLSVDDVEPGLNGGSAGLRMGDQLVAVNDEIVIGDSFTAVMTALQQAESPVQLTLYRGSIKSLYTIIQNRDGFEEAEPEEEVIMDENYESPVKIDISKYENQDDSISVGDVFKAFSKLAANAVPKDDAGSSKKDDTKKGGFLGGMFNQESIQLDGDDASTIN